MRNLIFASALSVLLVPHLSFAVEHSHTVGTTEVRHVSDHASRHSKAGLTTPVNINGANAEQLATLDGVGVKRAENIIAYRKAHGTFKTIDDLGHVKGIGPKGLLRLEKNNPGRIKLGNENK